MSQFYIYLHCKPNGDPFYVGKGTLARSHNLAKRSDHHKRIVAKYGIEIIVFQRESEHDALNDEIKWIKILREAGYLLCNITSGGEGHSGHSPSEETRRKISAAKYHIGD
jgi:hypothetical protein